MTKSYVTMNICCICSEPTGSLMIDRRLRETFEMYTKTPEPCANCVKKYLKKGVLLIEPKSGALVVLKNSAFKRIFNNPIPKQHIAFVEEGILERLQA